MQAEATVTVWHGAKIGPQADPARMIEYGGIAVRDGFITWIGDEAALPSAYTDVQRHDVGGQ